jgi:hypothetical protein
MGIIPIGVNMTDVNKRNFHGQLILTLRGLQSAKTSTAYLAVRLGGGAGLITPPDDYLDFSLRSMGILSGFGITPIETRGEYLKARPDWEYHLGILKEVDGLLEDSACYANGLIDSVPKDYKYNVPNEYEHYVDVPALTNEGVSYLMGYFKSNAMKNLHVFKGHTAGNPHPYSEPNQELYEQRFSNLLTKELLL